jgi:hypothetical protein
MSTHPFRLAPDYSKLYESLDPTCVRKDAFLQDARHLLRQTAIVLEAAGLRTQEIYTNRGGVAVSGDMIGRFALADTQCLEYLRGKSRNGGLNLFVNFTGFFLGRSSAELRSFSTGASVVGRARPDHITVMARVSEYKIEKRGKKDRLCIGQMGTNIWLNPNADSSQLFQSTLAQKLLEITQGQGYVKQSNVVDSQGCMSEDFAYGVDPNLLVYFAKIPAPAPPQQLSLFAKVEF